MTSLLELVRIYFMKLAYKFRLPFQWKLSIVNENKKNAVFNKQGPAPGV